MGKMGGLLTGLGVTGLGILWFYGVMYLWLWQGLVNSTTTGWIIGYALMFFIFVILTIVVIILLGIGYLVAAMIFEGK